MVGQSIDTHHVMNRGRLFLDFQPRVSLFELIEMHPVNVESSFKTNFLGKIQKISSNNCSQSDAAGLHALRDGQLKRKTRETALHRPTVHVVYLAGAP